MNSPNLCHFYLHPKIEINASLFIYAFTFTFSILEINLALTGICYIDKDSKFNVYPEKSVLVTEQ